MRIFINPNNGDLSPKKAIDQEKLNNSCAKKYKPAVLTAIFFHPFIQIKEKATPIIKYRNVQTGPKIQFGGANEGFVKYAYQDGIADIVKGVPKIPVSSHNAIE